MRVNYLLFCSYCLICLINLLIGIKRVNKKAQIPQNGYCDKRCFVIYQPLDKLFLFLLIAMMLYISIKTVELPDMDVYRRNYQTLNINVFEIGYYWISQFASSLQLSFELFRGVMISLSVLLIYKGIDKLNLNKNIVFAIYAIYPFTVDVIQIRNFLALGLVIYSLHFLSKRTTLGKVKFCVIIAISSLIHSLSIVYYVFLLADYDILEKKWKQKILGVTFAFSIIFAFLLRSSGEIQQIFYKLFFSFSEAKALAYVNWNMQWGFLLYWFMELLFIYVAYKVHKDQFPGKLSANHEKIFWNKMVLACLFPLLTVNINFYRIYRNMSVLNYALFDIIATKKKGYALLTIFVIALVLNYYVNISGDIDNVFWVFFRVS